MGDSTNNYLFRLYFGENIKTMDKSVPTLVLEQRRKKEGYKLDNEYYDLVLNGVKFSRKIYEPGLIEAEVTIDRIFYALDGTPLAPSVDKINNLFLMRRVELGIVNQDELNSNKDAKDERIARNYYVYKLNTQMTKGTGGNLMTVKLTIHSMDKLMTLDKYSKCYTAKKLGAEILEFEARSFGFKSRLLQTSSANLQSLIYNVSDKQFEYIHPYLVQYNESFYDFMVRTANRCGEFFYFEDGILNLGVPFKKDKCDLKIDNYENITFQEYSDTPVKVEAFARDSVKEGNGEVETLNFENIPKNKAGFPNDIFPEKPAYNVEIANDEYFYPIVGDKWTTFPYEMGFDPEYWSKGCWKDFGIALVLSVMGNELKNIDTDGVLNAIDFAINCAVEWGVLASKCFMFINMGKVTFGALASMEIDSTKSLQYMTPILEKEEQADKKANKVVAFGSLLPNGWTNLSFYRNIHQHELEQQQKMICIDMGTNYVPVKLGDTIQVEGLTGNYVVTEVKLLSDQKWTRNYKKFESDGTSTDIYSNKQSQVIYAIPTYKINVLIPLSLNKVQSFEFVVPPMVKIPLYKKAGPQTAFVVDNDDPKYQGRVRIVYPWQSQTEQVRVNLESSENDLNFEEEEISKVNALLAELEATRKRMNKMENIINDMAGKSEKERSRYAKELEITLKSDRLRIEELDIPGNTYDIDISKEPDKLAEVINNYAKENNLTEDEYYQLISNQAEVGRLKEEIKVLEAVLAAVNGEGQEDFDKMMADLKQEIDDNEKNLNDLNNQLEENKQKRKEKQQKLEEAKEKFDGDLLQLASPWVRIATPMATTGGGSFYKPQVGDEVLVNYDNDNVERPYVVGSLYSKNVQTPQFRNNIIGAKNPLLPNASTYIVSPNGHHIIFNDPADGTKLMEGLQPGLTFMTGMAGLKFEFAKDMAGGIHIGDRYGLYEISMSSHQRQINIRSPFGDVNVDAFSGITLNAPNGDVKISGKNISIEAGNNLTIKSGLNIQPPAPGHPEVKGKMGALVTGIAFGVVGGLTDVAAGMFVDMTFIRTFMEVMLRPIEGTLEIKSNRYLKLEAGPKSFAQIPIDRYSTQKKRNRRAVHEIEFMAMIVNCVQYINSTVNGFVDTYKTLWNTAYTLKDKYETMLIKMLKEEEVGNYVKITTNTCRMGWGANPNAEWSDVMKGSDFRGITNDDDVTVEGLEYRHRVQKEAALSYSANTFAKAVWDIHKHIDTFTHLFDNPVIEGVNAKMIELLTRTFNNRKEVRINEWESVNVANNGQVTIKFLSREIKTESDDVFVGTARKFKRAVAAAFLAEVANDPDFQLDENYGEGVGNKVANFLRNPLDKYAKGKFLHLHYEPGDVKEDRLDDEYHWHHFLAKMQKPEKAAVRKLYDSVVGTFRTRMNVDEFIKIHDREAWADRGYGTILMSDQVGETRVFNSGNFTVEQQATRGNWNALITALKAIQ